MTTVLSLAVVAVALLIYLLSNEKKTNQLLQAKLDDKSKKLEEVTKELSEVKKELEITKTQLHVVSVGGTSYTTSCSKSLLIKKRHDKMIDEAGYIIRSLIPGGTFNVLLYKDTLDLNGNEIDIQLIPTTGDSFIVTFKYDDDGNYLSHCLKQDMQVSIVEPVCQPTITPTDAPKTSAPKKSRKRKANPSDLANDFIQNNYDKLEELNQQGNADGSAIAKIPYSMLPSTDEDFMAALNDILVNEYGYMTVSFDADNEQLVAALPL